MSAADILKMIESVDPNDTARLDEIDARVECFRLARDFHGMTGSFRTKEYKAVFNDSDFYKTRGPIRCSFSDYALEYTRSRDALKSIRPEGCWVERIIQHKTSKSWDCTIAITGEVFSVSDKAITLPTEELAELHAIIQAIEYERNAP